MSLATTADAVVGTVLTVAFGAASTTYHLYATTAPVAYDGFGTFTIYDGGPGAERYVLIDAVHRQWQVERYASGLRRAVPSDAFTADDLTVRLRGAMRSGAAST